MLVFVGQVGSDFVDREAFQEVDYRRMYGSIAKWAAQIDRAGAHSRSTWRTPTASRCPGVPAPSCSRCPRTCWRRGRLRRCAAGRRDARALLRRADRGCARRLLAAATRRWCWWAAAAGMATRAPHLRHFAQRNALPVACAFRSQDLFDNRHPHYAGDVGIGINPKLAARVRDADVLLVIGERLGEMTTSRLHAARRAGAEAGADSRAPRHR